MVIIKRAKKSFIIFSSLAALLLISIPFSKTYYKNMYLSVYDKILTYDTGFSSIHNLFGEGSVSNFQNYPNALKKAPNVFWNIFYGSENKEDFNRIDIEVKFKDLLIILEDRKKAIKNGVGFDFREVDATIKFKDKTTDVKVRLKGDLADHWRSLHKMSLRVNVESGNSIMGLRKFSIHKPSARQHPYDQTFQDIQRQLGNISSQNNYVTVYFNGEKWGLMNIEEHVSKEFLEKQGLKESLILKFENELSWKYDEMVIEKYDNYKLSDERLHLSAYTSEKYLTQVIYRKWYSYIGKENLKDNTKLYDNDSFSKTLLHSMAWNRLHTLSPANSRYYFNPFSLKLEPITTDQAHFSELKDSLLLPYFYRKIVRSNEFDSNLERNLKEVKKGISSSQSVMDYWLSIFPLDEKINTTILTENFNKLSTNIKKYIVEEVDAKSSKKSITETQSKGFIDHIYGRHFDNGEIHFYNLLDETILINNIKLDGLNLNTIKNPIELQGFTDTLRPLVVETNLKGILDNRIVIETEHQGNIREFKIDFTHLTNNINNPLNSESNIENFNFIERVDDDNYIIKRGKWEVKSPIIINGNLIIPDNTTMSFNENSYLLVKGSVNINGNKGREVVMKSVKNKWKGIYVFEAAKESVFNNVIIQDIDFFQDGLLSLTGGVSFYKSDVQIKNSKIYNSIAEDALNIIHSKFNIDNLTIEKTNSDGFDSDFSEGTINNSSFKNIGGDAIDFSGSKVSVNNSKFDNVRDKAISSGEKSKLTLTDLSISNIGVAITSKDGSIVNARNILIEKFSLNAIMTYQKKSFYEIPELYGEMINVKFDENAYLRQTGSRMKINGEEIEEKYLDVENLYTLDTMKK